MSEPGLREGIREFVPSWLADRWPSAFSVGYRVLWANAVLVDAAIEAMSQASLAARGRGTVTALPILGAERGVVRAQDDTNASFAARLRTWIDIHRTRGSSEALARRVHEYLASHPKVRVITRGGQWVTLNVDGTVEREQAAWDWDSVSHPERSGWWSDLFVVVYVTSQWPEREGYGSGGVWGGEGGVGHLVSRAERDVLVRIFSDWKAAHSRVRAVIWTTDPSRFDPSDPGSCPDGTWGAWGTRGSGSRVASGRDLTTCRFWEF